MQLKLHLYVNAAMAIYCLHMPTDFLEGTVNGFKQLLEKVDFV